jgi:adenylate cyclase
MKTLLPGAFLWQLIRIYIYGTVTATGVVMVLMYLGLDMTTEKWFLFMMSLPVATFVFIGPDIFLIARHSKPIRVVLDAVEQKKPVSSHDIDSALTALLNLPFFSFLRVTFLHGPLACISLIGTLISYNSTLNFGFATWQIYTTAACIVFFAAPVHAIIEYFSLNKLIPPLVARLESYSDSFGQIESISRPIAVPLRYKLIYLSLFLAAIPMVFFAGSTLVKVNVLLGDLGVVATTEQLIPLWIWLSGVTIVTGVAAVIMSALTASDVSHAAKRLVDAMKKIEAGNLEAKLDITTTDEYADLFRGFNKMVDSLREEIHMLEVTHDLAGEIEIDVLISRIMTSATLLLDADRSTLLLYDEKTGELWSRFAEELEVKEIRLSSSEGIAGTVYREGKVINLVDAYDDARFNRSVDLATGYRTKSMIAMPVVGKKGQIIGVVEVLNKANGKTFSPKDEIRLRAFAAEVGISLDNSRLLDEVRKVNNYNESILKSTSNGLITIDEKGVIASVNQAAYEILEIDSIPMVGKHIEDPAMALGHQNPWIIESLERAKATQTRQLNVDYTLKWHGIEKSVNAVSTPLIGLEGESIGTMLVLEDITTEKRVKTTMARYMSVEVAEQLLAGGEDQLGGKDQEIVILFSDIRSFTTLSEKLGARGTVNMLNEYFAEMVDVIFKHKGILDKYIGDAMMALFGAPFTADDDADRAVITAEEMMAELEQLNQKREDKGLQPIHIGVGLAMGKVVVGNIGSPKRMEYTVIGDSVNLASRLEGANKFYGTSILISESLATRLKRPTLLREVDKLRVKGKNEPVTIFEVAGHLKGTERSVYESMLSLYQSGMDAYRVQHWDDAEKAFKAVLQLRPTDGPSALYLERIGQLRYAPPQENWDGVWTMTEK